MNIRIPKLIVIREFNGYLINSEEKEVFKLVERLEKCLPEGNRVQCHVIFDRHLKEERIRMFKRIHYHYFSIKKEGGEYLKENLFILNGTLFVDDVMIDNSMNEIIEKVCPLQIKYRYVTNRDNENWTLPSCVKKLLIQHNVCRLFVVHNSRNVNVEMPSIEELTLFETRNIQFNQKDMTNLRVLKIEESSGVELNSVKFPALVMIFINRSNKIVFSENCEFNQNKEKGLVIKIINSDDNIFDCKMNYVKELVVIQSERIIVTCDQPQLMKKYQVLSTLFFTKDDYEQYDKEINVRQMLEDEENNSDTFVLQPFISYSS